MLHTLIRRAALAVAIVTSLASPAFAQANNATRWFPLQTDNEWILESNNDTIEIRCTYEYGAYRWVEGLHPDGCWAGYSATTPTNLYLWNPDGQAWWRYLRLGAFYSGWSFSFNDGGCGTFGASWQNNNQRVATPAGTFSGCRKTTFSLRPAPNVRCAAPIQSLTVAPGVGPVAAVKGGTTYLLKRAKVGTKTYPQGAPQPTQNFQATLTMDRTSYVNKPNTIRCITTPCPSNEVTAAANFTLTVTNVSGAVKVIEHSSGQNFEFEITDQAGRVQKAWSDGRYFTQALTATNFQPGETKTFRGQVALKDRSEYQLDGTYTVKGHLKAANWSTVPGPEATARLSVTIQ